MPLPLEQFLQSHRMLDLEATLDIIQCNGASRLFQGLSIWTKSLWELVKNSNSLNLSHTGCPNSQSIWLQHLLLKFNSLGNSHPDGRTSLRITVPVQFFFHCGADYYIVFMTCRSSLRPLFTVGLGSAEVPLAELVAATVAGPQERLLGTRRCPGPSLGTCTCGSTRTQQL